MREIVVKLFGIKIIHIHFINKKPNKDTCKVRKPDSFNLC